MRSRIATGFSLLVIVSLAHPAGAADGMSVKSLRARLAANPTGEEARALAEDIRTWFGKDRAGRPNVDGGANPEGRGPGDRLGHRGPGREVGRDRHRRRQDHPADRGSAIPRSSPPPSRSPTGRRSAGPTSPTTATASGKQRTGRSLQRPARADREARRAQGQAHATDRPGRARSSPAPRATGGSTSPPNTRTTSPPASWSFRTAAATRASCRPSSTT